MASEGLKSFLAGWAGGVGILAVGHPFDTIKTRLQADTTGRYKGAIDCLRQTIKAEGPLAVYKGITAPLTGVGAVFALYFLAYDSSERFLRWQSGKEKSKPLSLPEVMVCGAFTGVVGTSLLAPSELLKVQQQTAVLAGRDGSFGAVVRGIYAERGLRGFLTGVGATLARDVPGSMAWFGAYEMAKQTMCDDPTKPTVTQALIAGGCGGLGNWCLVLPLDTVKTRVQSTRGRSLNFQQAAREIFAEGGMKNFYKGIGPILLRAFPANAACFAAKEVAQKALDKVM